MTVIGLAWSKTLKVVADVYRMCMDMIGPITND